MLQPSFFRLAGFGFGSHDDGPTAPPGTEFTPVRSTVWVLEARMRSCTPVAVGSSIAGSPGPKRSRPESLIFDLSVLPESLALMIRVPPLQSRAISKLPGEGVSHAHTTFWPFWLVMSENSASGVGQFGRLPASVPHVEPVCWRRKSISELSLRRY